MIQEDSGWCREQVEELLRYKERLHAALKASGQCVFEVDLSRQLYTFFENAEGIFGISGEQILREVRAFHTLSPIAYQQAVTNYFAHPGDADAIRQAFQSILAGKPVSYKARMKAGNTEYCWCKIDAFPIVEHGIPVRMVGMITDINDLILRVEQLQKQVNIDKFTGLYHKKEAEERIHSILMKYPHRRHALLLIDLDHFKRINDCYGHTKGDQVLLSVAEKLRRVFRRTDVLGRFGGDEFIVLVRELRNCGTLIEKMRELVTVGNGALHFTMSIGVAVYPDHARDYERLFHRADQALYLAKKSHNAFYICGSRQGEFE